MGTVNFKNRVEPLRRDIRFRLSRDRIHNWNSVGVVFTQFMNALSIFFPDGERFFIDSLRNYRDRIKDEQLKKDVHAFIGQEAMHTREHVEYNKVMIDEGYPVAKQMKFLAVFLKFVQMILPKHMQLAVTMALEHLTATLGDILLRLPETLEGAEENYKMMWQWHALEEIEHKGVSFDVWREVMPQTPYSYLVRVIAYVLSHSIFWTFTFVYHLMLIRKSKQKATLRDWWSFVSHMWFSPGVMRKIQGEMFDYLRPGFHPWNYDNRHLLENIEDFATDAKALYQQDKAAPAAAA